MKVFLFLTVFFLAISCSQPAPSKDPVKRAETGGEITGGEAQDKAETDEKPAELAKRRWTSKYSDLVENKCTDVELNEEEEWSVQQCEGFEGFKLEVVEGDLRQSINVISPEKQKFELKMWSVVSNLPSTVGDKAEWRFENINGKPTPTALIVRYNVSESESTPDKMTSYLTVSKISSAGACITAVIKPIRNANLEARKKAENASKAPCLKS